MHRRDFADFGSLNTHIHMISPQQAWEALSNGITTLIGGGTGPADGTRATTCTPGTWHIERMLRAADVLPVNWGVLAKGNASEIDGREEHRKSETWQ